MGLVFFLLPSAAMSVLSDEFMNALKASNNPNVFNHPLYEDMISNLKDSESNETFYPAETSYPEEEIPTPYPSILEDRTSDLPQNETKSRQSETPPTTSPTAPSKSLKGAEYISQKKKRDHSSVKRKGYTKKSKKKSKITRVPVTPSPTISASPTATAAPTDIAPASLPTSPSYQHYYGKGKGSYPSKKHDRYYHYYLHEPTSSPAPSGIFYERGKSGKGKGRPKLSMKKKKDGKKKGGAKSRKISKKSKSSKESRSSKSSRSKISKIYDSPAPSVSFSPTVAPEPTISPHPTIPPTQTPTLQPVIPGTPAVSPTTRPTGSPVVSPTSSPIRPPTEDSAVSPTPAPVGGDLSEPSGTEAPTAAPVGGEPTETPETQAPTTDAPTTVNATDTPTLANATLSPDTTGAPTLGATTLVSGGNETGAPTLAATTLSPDDGAGGETTDSPTMTSTTAEPTIVINDSQGTPTAAPADGGIPTRAYIVTYMLTSTDAISPEDFAASESETCTHLNNYMTDFWSKNPFIEFESLDCVAVSTRADPAVQIDLLLEPNFLQGGNMVTEEDVILLYFAALSPPGSAPLIAALQALDQSNPFSTTTAVTVELPAELRGSFSSTSFNGEGTFSSDAVESSSSNPLLVAMVAVSFIMICSFVGVVLVRKRNNRQLRAMYMVGKENDFRILEDDIEDETGNSTSSYHDYEQQQQQQDETTAILFAPIDNDNHKEETTPYHSPLFGRSITEI